MKTRDVLLLVFVLAIAIAGIFVYQNSLRTSQPIQYTYTVQNMYPHDKTAFTEGLVYENGYLYESTGLYGNSSLRKVDLKTGKTLQIYKLQSQYFGEGITVFNNTIIQLTWQSHVGFVYNESTFAIIKVFSYPTEGWGLTSDSSRLIMSDGSADLYFLNPKTFQRISQIIVHDNSGPVTKLNELEYVNGDVYANIWQDNRIAIINPQNGVVKAWIDLTGIQKNPNNDPEAVLNGIAYDSAGNRLFVTGKMWTSIYEIKMLPK